MSGSLEVGFFFLYGGKVGIYCRNNQSPLLVLCVCARAHVKRFTNSSYGGVDMVRHVGKGGQYGE